MLEILDYDVITSWLRNSPVKFERDATGGGGGGWGKGEEGKKLIEIFWRSVLTGFWCWVIIDHDVNDWLRYLVDKFENSQENRLRSIEKCFLVMNDRDSSLTGNISRLGGWGGGVGGGVLLLRRHNHLELFFPPFLAWKWEKDTKAEKKISRCRPNP